MTIKNFLRRLRRTRSKIDWQVSRFGYIRGYNSDDGFAFCPVTAVYYTATKQKLPATQAWAVPKAFCLKVDDEFSLKVDEIIKAADRKYYQGQIPKNFRKRILNALDLKEVETR